MATQTTIGLTATLDISDFQRNANLYMRTLQQMQQAASQSTTSINNSFSSTGAMGSKLIPTLDSIGKGFLAIGAAATAAAAGGIAYLASSSIQMASDFEQGLADIAARMRETVDSVTPLRDEIYNLALNPGLKVSLDDAAQASMQLASAGVTMQEQLGGALQSTIEFQNAVGGDFGLAANVAIAAMDTFGLSSDSMGAAVDGATGAINRSKLDLQKYSYVITNAGTAWAGFGGSLAELNTVAAATASVFNTGQRQGTGMAEMMNRMAVPTAKAKDRMKELGITFWDNTGKAKNLFNIVDELRAKLSTLSQEEQRAFLVNVFGKQGGVAMIALLQKTGDELRALQAEVNASGQAATAAATRMDTLQGAFGAFTDLVSATATSIGSMFTPILKNSFQSINASLTPLVKAFDQFGLSGVANTMKLSDATIQMATSIDESFKKLYATLTTGGITAALEEMGFNIDYLTTGLYALTGAVTGLVILGTVAAGIFATGAAIAALSNPIGQAIAGAALLGAAWNTNFLGIQDIVFATYDRISTMLSQLVTITEVYISRWITLFSKGATAIYDGLSAVFFALPEPVKVAMTQVYDVIVGTMNQAIDYFNNALSSISSAAGGYIPSISLPSLSGLAFPDMAGSGAGLSESISSMFALPESVGQTFDVGTESVYRFQAATTAATQAAMTSKLAFADETSGLIDLTGGMNDNASAADKAGKAALKMAEDVKKAKEKISDTDLSMANLRGEIQQLEGQFPGLTQEVIANFNAHTKAGGSVASFGDKLGATERRQMFSYLTKLIDMNEANKELMASNGLVDKSFTNVGDGFMDMVNTMKEGLGTPMAELPVVASLLPTAEAQPDMATANQAQTAQATAMTATTTAATTLNPLLTTMAAIYNDSLNPALQLASTYLPIISQSLVTINEALTILTTTPLPLFGTTLQTIINPALLATQIQVTILSNTAFAGLTNMILGQVLPALGQLFTSLGTQVIPMFLQAGIQSDLLRDAYQRLIDIGTAVVKSSQKTIEAMEKEAKMVSDLVKYYEALYRAKRDVTTAPGSLGAPAEGSGAGFASGGQFIVPSGYPAGGYGMPIRVHSGELVKVFTAAQTRQMARSQGNQRIVSSSNSTTNNSNRVVNFNITTQQPSKSILNDLAFAKAKYGVF